MAGIKIGDHEDQVTTVLGQPTKSFPVRSIQGELLDYALIYEYKGMLLGVYTTKDNLTVHRIRLLDSDFNKHNVIPKVEGVTVGSLFDQLFESLGRPKLTQEHFTCLENLGDTPEARRTITYKYDGISFWVCAVNEKVFLIDIPF
jgi:hypothetical protein